MCVCVSPIMLQLLHKLITVSENEQNQLTMMFSCDVLQQPQSYHRRGPDHCSVRWRCSLLSCTMAIRLLKLPLTRGPQRAENATSRTSIMKTCFLVLWVTGPLRFYVNTPGMTYRSMLYCAAGLRKSGSIFMGTDQLIENYAS